MCLKPLTSFVFQQEACKKRLEMPMLKPILEPFMLMSRIKETRFCDKQGESLTVRHPLIVQEIEQIHMLYRKAAQRGDGYAIDEFTEDGLLNLRTLKDAVITGVFTSEGAVVGAACFGKSAIPRIPEKCIGGLVVVDESYRHRGVGTELLRVIERYAEELGKDDLIHDVLTSNKSAIWWLQKEGYVVTGTIANSGVMANKKFTDSVVMYKSLNKHTDSFPYRMSKI